MLHTDFHLYDLIRSPQWRLDRALSIAESMPARLRGSRYDDKYVRTYLKFWRDYLAAFDIAQQETEGTTREIVETAVMQRLFSREAGIWFAHRTHTYGDPEWRSLLQARILAREDDWEIAGQFGTLPGAVDWYEKIFFNVRDRLDARTWIAKVILGSWESRAPSSSGVLTANQRDLLYKSFAYHGGTHALDAIVHGFEISSLPASSSGMTTWLDNSLKYMMKTRSVAALQTLEVNRYNVMQLLDLCFHVMTGEGSTQESGSSLLDGVEEAFASIRWTLPEREMSKGEARPTLLTGPTEPRSQELLVIGAGGTPMSLLEARSIYDAPAAVG